MIAFRTFCVKIERYAGVSAKRRYEARSTALTSRATSLSDPCFAAKGFAASQSGKPRCDLAFVAEALCAFAATKLSFQPSQPKLLSRCIRSSQRHTKPN